MKKIFSFVVALAAVAMVGCCGNANTKSAEAQAEETVVEAQAEENTCCGACEKSDSTACDKCAEVETEAAAE
ncbi:MAG: hypothetical protein K2L06_01685 [Alistipes sp.]|nr:hypothetical protein [Alistipes sp.]